MANTINLFWFRRDLRIDDNHGLFAALSADKNVLPIFIFDTDILNLLEDKQDQRVEFIHNELKSLKNIFENNGSSLLVLIGKPLEIFTKLTSQYNIASVFTNGDYEPYGLNRDMQVEEFLKTKKINFKSYKDIVIFEKNEILKDDNTPYTVFTPYSKKWKKALHGYVINEFASEEKLNNLLQIDAFPFPSLEQIGFSISNKLMPGKKIEIDKITQYEHYRDIPSANGTSRLSVHLRFGTLSIRKLVKIAVQHSEKFLNELIWRDFYQSVLFHFPHVVNSAFKTEYNRIQWSHNEHHFNLWCNGLTGFPIVDAGMRELNATGYMHNRVRMIVSSFLTKDLFIDWRWGEHYFANKLIDFELASNNGGWQWAAGCGVDAAPYFRIFNPSIQLQKFDPQLNYVKKWIPEYGSADYPKPIVDHRVAAKQTIDKYKRMLTMSK